MIRKLGALVIAIVVVLIIALLLIVVRNRPASRRQTVHFDKVVGFNEEILYDDFAYMVLSVRKAHMLGSATAQGDYDIVRLKVLDHALRVQYRFDSAAVHLIDSQGRDYRLSTDGQKALTAEQGSADPCAVTLHPGESCITDIVFDVPADVRDLYLTISTDGVVGDVLETVFFGNKAIRIR